MLLFCNKIKNIIVYINSENKNKEILKYDEYFKWNGKKINLNILDNEFEIIKLEDYTYPMLIFIVDSHNDICHIGTRKINGIFSESDCNCCATNIYNENWNVIDSMCIKSTKITIKFEKTSCFSVKHIKKSSIPIVLDFCLPNIKTRRKFNIK